MGFSANHEPVKRPLVRCLMQRGIISATVMMLLLAVAIGCHVVSDSTTNDCEQCESETRCEPVGYIKSRLSPDGHYVRCLDEKLTTHNAIFRANSAMRCDFNEPPSNDTQAGYRAAFVDIALGGSGEVPPVPPERYWYTCYRTASGHARAQEWFAGYVRGAATALSHCRQAYANVASSGRTAYTSEREWGTYGSAPAHNPGCGW